MAAANGHPTERVVGSGSAASLPLGAVASLLAAGLGHSDADGQLDAEALFEHTRQALLERHNNTRVVTVADDVPLLDSASVALLDHLARHGTIFLIATARAAEPTPDLLTDLIRDSALARVDLADLSPAGLDTLLHLALGGPMEAGAAQEILPITRGNPLHVPVIVLCAIETSARVHPFSVWDLCELLSSTSLL